MYIKSKDVFKLLKVTRPTLCKYVKEGKLRAIKINKTKLDYNEYDVFTLAGIKIEVKLSYMQGHQHRNKFQFYKIR